MTVGNFRYRGSPNNTEPFKTSGPPYLHRGQFASGSGVKEDMIRLPSLSSGITVVNESTNNAGTIMHLHFGSRTGNTKVVGTDGTGCNVALNPGETVSIDAKCLDFYVSRDDDNVPASYYTAIVQLSDVYSNEYVLSGSGINL